jgi:hypothetical protein
VVAEAEQVSQIDRPVLRFDGSEVELEASATGGECGVWVDEEDQRRIEITGEHARDLGMEEVLEQLNSNIWEEARAMKQAH